MFIIKTCYSPHKFSHFISYSSIFRVSCFSGYLFISYIVTVEQLPLHRQETLTFLQSGEWRVSGECQGVSGRGVTAETGGTAGRWDGGIVMVRPPAWSTPRLRLTQSRLAKPPLVASKVSFPLFSAGNTSPLQPTSPQSFPSLPFSLP